MKKRNQRLEHCGLRLFVNGKHVATCSQPPEHAGDHGTPGVSTIICQLVMPADPNDKIEVKDASTSDSGGKSDG